MGNSLVPSQRKLAGNLEYFRNLSLFWGVARLPRKELHLKALNVKITHNKEEDTRLKSPILKPDPECPVT